MYYFITKYKLDNININKYKLDNIKYDIFR